MPVYLGFLRPQAIPREVEEFLVRAEKLPIPKISYIGVVVRCEQCREEYGTTATESYLDPPHRNGGGPSWRTSQPVPLYSGRFMSERYKKLKGCPVCQSCYGKVIRLIQG